MRMKLKSVPCYNCITLGMCKAKLETWWFHSKDTINEALWADIIHMSMTCQLLYEYITPHQNYTYNIYQRRLAAHYLSAIDLGGNQEGYSITDINELYEIAKMENPHIGVINGS